MSDGEEKRTGVGCWFFRKRSNGRAPKKDVKRNSSASPEHDPVAQVSLNTVRRSKSSDSLASVISSDSAASGMSFLDSFAVIERCRAARKSRTTPVGYVRTEKWLMMPYFGHFAGQRLIFDLKFTESMVIIRVKTEDHRLLATLQHRPLGRRRETVKDQCVKFANEVALESGSSRQPHRLSFLCEQSVLLRVNELPVHLLPVRYQPTFQECTHTVYITVRPRRMHIGLLTMKVKPRVSVREFQWMICRRLGLSDPSALALYIKDALEPISPTLPLADCSQELVCIVSPMAVQERGFAGQTSVCVSVIGRGVDEILVDHTTTLHDFDQALKKTFQLRSDSFVYYPELMRKSRYGSSHCPLRMCALLDSNTSLLLDPERRSFPTLYGLLNVCEQSVLHTLLLYQTTLSKLDMLNSGPVICFEVTGPTIPVSFKTVHSTKPTDVVSSCNENFCMISIEPHALSVNNEWSLEILLKYISCISGFPCNQLKLKGQMLHNKSSVSSQLLQRPWFDMHNHLLCAIPEALP